MPFGPDCEYEDFAACVRANSDKDDPEAYCAAIQEETEDHCNSSDSEVNMSAPRTIARENLEREVPFGLIRSDGDGGEDAGRILDGFAAVFNRETIIDSWEGRFREKVMPGSMAKSFRDKPPRIQFDHGRHPMVGSIPIAQVRSVEEGSHPELAPEGGAHVVGRLHSNWLVEPVREAIASGSVNGMSFRFSVVRERWLDTAGREITDEEELFEELFRSWWEDVPDDELLTRELNELRVPELGPVVWPAYEQTSVGVRARDVAKALREDERLVKVVRRTLAADGDRATKLLEHMLERIANEEALQAFRNREERRQVACALTLSDNMSKPHVPDGATDAPPESGHPSDRPADAPPESGHPSGEGDGRGDAPPESGHPSDGTDAPPESGHPSKMTHSRMGAESDLVVGFWDYAVRVGADLEQGDEG